MPRDWQRPAAASCHRSQFPVKVIDFTRNGGSSIELKFVLNKDDFWQFAKYLSIHTPAIRRRYLINLLMVGVAFFSLFSYVFLSGIEELPRRLLVSFAVTIASVTLFIYYFPKWVAMKELKKNPWLIGERSMRFAADSFTVKSRNGQSVTKWGDVGAVVEDKKHYYLLTKQSVNFIVPKRAFGDRDKAQKFFERSVSTWQASANTAGNISLEQPS